MKKIQKMCFLALVGLMVGTSCEKTSNPDPQTGCIEGVVIATVRSRTNPDLDLIKSCETIVQIKNRNIGEQVGKHSNCLVITNLDVSLAKLNQKVFFDSFVDAPPYGGGTADCFANPEKRIIATNITTECEK